MSTQVKQFSHDHGISSSRTTFNPQGNGQCERYNGMLWKAVTMALKSRDLSNSQFFLMLYTLYTLILSTATNSTPQERLFDYQRRSASGQSLPSWLTTPGPVLVKRHVRQSKYDPIVDEAEFLEANPQYAHVRFSNGKESTVSLRDMTPCADAQSGDGRSSEQLSNDHSPVNLGLPVPHSPSEVDVLSPEESSETLPIHETSDTQPALHSSGRIRRPVDRLRIE